MPTPPADTSYIAHAVTADSALAIQLPLVRLTRIQGKAFRMLQHKNRLARQEPRGEAPHVNQSTASASPAFRLDGPASSKAPALQVPLMAQAATVNLLLPAPALTLPGPGAETIPGLPGTMPLLSGSSRIFARPRRGRFPLPQSPPDCRELLWQLFGLLLTGPFSKGELDLLIQELCASWTYAIPGRRRRRGTAAALPLGPGGGTEVRIGKRSIRIYAGEVAEGDFLSLLFLIHVSGAVQQAQIHQLVQ